LRRTAETLVPKADKLVQNECFTCSSLCILSST
jgi:hypothetical protein